MEVTHETKNIKELEFKLGFDSIELFIELYKNDVGLIDDMVIYKPWEEQELSEFNKKMFEMSKIPLNDHLKHQQLIEKNNKEQGLLT